MNCPTCNGRGRYRIGPEDWPCPDCDTTGEVRGICWGCSEPLRDCDRGNNCLERVEHDEVQTVAHLDTRPEERAELARVRWLNLRSQLAFLSWRHHQWRRPPDLQDVNDLLARAEAAWGWRLAWEAACAR